MFIRDAGRPWQNHLENMTLNGSMGRSRSLIPALGVKRVEVGYLTHDSVFKTRRQLWHVLALNRTIINGLITPATKVINIYIYINHSVPVII